MVGWRGAVRGWARDRTGNVGRARSQRLSEATLLPCERPLQGGDGNWRM